MVYNYTEDRNLQEITTFFENLCQQERSLFEMDLALKYDRLGIPKKLDELDSSLNAKRIVAPERFAPVLERIYADETLMNLARKEAKKLLARIEKMNDFFELNRAQSLAFLDNPSRSSTILNNKSPQAVLPWEVAMRPKLLLALIVPLIVASVPFQAVEVPPARMLRVSLLEGDVTYQRPDLDRWVDLSINTPIFEGDKVWVGRGGRAEVEFENGGFARLSENTILEFSRLSDVSSRSGVEVRLIQGLASFQTRAEPAFTIQTPLFSAKLADAASFRVEVDTDGSGRLVVFDGKLEVSGQDSRLFVRNGELVRFLSQDANRYYLETNYVKDEWDRWNEERNDYLTQDNAGAIS